jgi:WD40 repeat protein
MTSLINRCLVSIFLFLISFPSSSQTNLLLQKGKVRDTVYDIRFTAGGSWLAAANSKSAILYDMTTGDILKKFENGHRKEILTLDISSDSAMIATGGKDSTIVIWSVSSGKLIRKLKLHSGIITQVRFSHDGNYLYSSGTDGKIVLYSIASDAEVFSKQISGKIITSFDVSNSSYLLATTGSDGRIIIINSLTGELISVLSEANGWLRDIAFSPDGSRLIAGGDNGKILLWKVEPPSAFKQVSSERSCKNWIYGVDFLSDNQTFAFCGFDNNFYVIIGDSKYFFDTGAMVFKVRFKPAGGTDIIAAAATFGRGVIIKNASVMKLGK